MSGDILDTIDHVLADFEVSGDAMRWTPEPQPERPQGGVERWLNADAWAWDPTPLSLHLDEMCGSFGIELLPFQRYYLNAWLEYPTNGRVDLTVSAT